MLVVGCSEKEVATPDPSSSEEATTAVSPDVPQSDLKPAGDEASPGLAIGTEAPKFDLPDQYGETKSLVELLKTSRVALVFYRSADW